MYLELYRKRVEEELIRAVGRFGEKSALRDACEYSLLCGGKRLRPILVMMIGDALGHGLDVMPAALGVEYFHTASLIADDLPCMDNDDVRRNRPSLHKAAGQAAAILASYTLIAEGYGSIHANRERMKEDSRFGKKADEAAFACLAAATRCAGIQGATSGQYLDLFPPDLTWETIRKVIVQKTVTLFEVSFIFGWMFGGGDSGALEEIRNAAYHLGMAFQVADDLDDDGQVVGINSAAVLGREHAMSLFEREMGLLRCSLEGLGLWTEPFGELYEALDLSVCRRLLRQ